MTDPALEVHILTALQDNYIYVLREPQTGQVAVVDPTLASPVLEFLKAKQWKLHHIFNTHHHGDHVGGNHELQQATGCEITGFAGDAQRIPGITMQVKDGQVFPFGALDIEVLHVPGHTTGAITYHIPGAKAAFTGDTLFVMGCGRLFEGTARQMFDSLQRLKALPKETQFYSGHEYAEHNGAFALTIEPENVLLQKRMQTIRALREQAVPIQPAMLQEELDTNPFLRADSCEEFTRRRELRNKF